jgi:hypothetical protein
MNVETFTIVKHGQKIRIFREAEKVKTVENYYNVLVKETGMSSPGPLTAEIIHLNKKELETVLEEVKDQEREV